MSKFNHTTGLIYQSMFKVRWVHISIASTVIVNLCAFTMSLVALTDLATANGVPSWQGWMLPVLLEGLVLAATAGTATLKGWVSLYAWALMILSSATSGAGNVVHAQLNGGTVVAMVIAGIPSLWLLLSTHLTMILTHRRADKIGVPVAAHVDVLTPIAIPSNVAAQRPVADAPPVVSAPVTTIVGTPLPIVAAADQIVAEEQALVAA